MTEKELRNLVSMFRFRMEDEMGFNIAEIREIDIPPVCRDKAAGWCIRTGDFSETCRLGFAKWTLSLPRKDLLSIVLHELCHAIMMRGAMGSHKGEWRMFAKEVSQYFHVPITQYVDEEILDVKRDSGTVPYVVRCPDCGSYQIRYRRVGIVKSLLDGEEVLCDCGGALYIDTELSVAACEAP